MGLMQQALETYEYAKEKFAGKYIKPQKEPLAPMGHTIANAAIEIIINHEGTFLQASAVSKDDGKTIFPVTEASSGRTSSPAPHPLCEQLGYLIAQNEDKYHLYLNQLKSWMESAYSHPMLQPVHTYVSQGTILTDLLTAELISSDEKGKLKDEKQLIRWRVEGCGDWDSACWTNESLQQSYCSFYRSQKNESATCVCMITGNEGQIAQQHAKGVVSLNGNAKIISANDNSGFTYRGRFLQDSEALTISYEASQKAHNALRWLIANQGAYIGGRCFVCWNPQGKKIPTATQRFGPTRQPEKSPVYTPTSYRESLRDALKGWKSTFAPNEKAVTAVFDAATTGRLSLNYYSELQATDFLDRLAFWDETCCWQNSNFGVQSPDIYKIAEYAFGTLRTDHIEADDKIKKQAMLRLLSCRLERAKIPRDIVRQLVQKSGNLHLYEDSEKTKYLRSQLLFITCATIKKYRYDYDKEDWSMALEPEKQDRSYQFGRLLAVMEKIERDTYSKEEKRETNAIRRQMAFVARPFSTFASVMGHLKNAYYPQLTPGGRAYYDKLVGQITEQLSAFTSELNQPLAETYLLGYYLQRNDFYTKKETSEE